MLETNVKDIIPTDSECLCVSWNKDTHEFDNAPECWGDCQDNDGEDY